jgi:RecA-family ATPase
VTNVVDIRSRPKVTPWDAAIHVAPSSFFTDKPPARDYLLRDLRRDGCGVLVAGKVGALVAEGGVGKTQSAFDLAVAVATGGAWLGSINASRTGKVLIVLGEEDKEEAQRRAFVASLGTRPPADGTITVLPLHGMACAMLENDERKNTIEAPFLRWLRDYLAKHGPFSLVILDPLTRFAGPEAEKDNAQGTRFVQAVESLVTPSGGAAIIVAHHTNKMGRTGATVSTVASRGSSSLTDGFRWVATMASNDLVFDDPILRDRLGEIVTVSFTKSNYSRKGAPILLRRGEHGALVPLDAADLEIVNEAQSGDTARTAKARVREAERDRVRHERATKDAALQADREAHANAARRQRDADDDAAARDVARESRNGLAQLLEEQFLGRGREIAGHDALDDDPQAQQFIAQFRNTIPYVLGRLNFAQIRVKPPLNFTFHFA